MKAAVAATAAVRSPREQQLSQQAPPDTGKANFLLTSQRKTINNKRSNKQVSQHKQYTSDILLSTCSFSTKDIRDSLRGSSVKHTLYHIISCYMLISCIVLCIYIYIYMYIYIYIYREREKESEICIGIGMPPLSLSIYIYI